MTRWPEQETVNDGSQGVQLARARFYWNRVSKGGHFAAFEQPALFTSELRACFASVRT